MKCRFIDTGMHDAYANMAIDETILNSCNAPVLRVYQWATPSITIGYNQNINEEVNIKRCNELKISIVRRITGGKAVLHEKDITYSFIVPENELSLPRDIVQSYRMIANALVIALKAVGINAEISKQKEKLETPICFNSSNWYELLANKKKISGSAQRRLQGKILQHGPILLDFDFDKNASVFAGANPNKLSAELRKRITSVRHELGRDISYERMASAVKYGFQKNFKLEFFDMPLTKKELRMAEELRVEKYAKDSWNKRL